MTPMNPVREAVLIVGNGTVTALAGGPVSLASLGERTTERASRLEFCSIDNQWHVYAAASGGDLYCHPDYDVALRWEIDHFNRQLSLVG